MKKLVTLLLCGSAALSACADTSVVFNEIMYHPATNESSMEWVELYNQLAVDVDISGWTIANGISYTFPSNSIIHGGGFAVVAISPAELASATGLTNIYGPFSGQLSNSGEKLELHNNNGRLVDEITYDVDGDWPVAPDGSGVSLAKVDHDTESGTAANWSFSTQVGGTPGSENFTVSQPAGTTQLFVQDAAWKYDASGSDLGTSWQQPGFDDSSWPTGAAWFYNSTKAGGPTLSIPALFNTGVDDNGAALLQGQPDPHYTIVAAAQGSTNISATSITNHPAWLANDPTSTWINPVTDGSTPIAAGAYNYLTRFSLDHFYVGSAQIKLSFNVDDALNDVLLNGTSLGISGSGFASYNGPININSGFISGTNTLEFRTANSSFGPGGFRAKLTGSALYTQTNTFLASGPDTYYFRKAFTLSGDPGNTVLRLNSIAADGAVIYLNGAEVQRWNMPTGAITYSTLAVSNLNASTATTPTNLIAWWKLDEASGTSAADCSGNAHTAALVNSPVWTNGQWNGGISCSSASSQSVNAGPLAAMNGVSHLTISAWVRKKTGNSLAEVGQYTEEGKEELISISGTTVFWHISRFGSYYYGFCAAPNDNAWHHYTLVFDGTTGGHTIFGYIDGVRQTLSYNVSGDSIATVTPFSVFAPDKFCIGSAGTSRYSDASFDDVRVYSASLTASDVANLYAQGASDICAGSGGGSGNGPAFTGFTLLPSTNLVAGTNVLAIEVHRAAGSVSNLLMGAELTATPAVPQVTFNEIGAASDSAFWLELMNAGTNLAALENFVIELDGNINVDYVIPPGTFILPGSFLALSNVLGFQPVSGDKLFLYTPGRSNVVDSVVVKNKLRGRSPDGTGSWLYPNAPTPGASNNFSFHSEIVINEIMYNHHDLSGTNGSLPQPSSEAWVELYNRTANAVDLTGWSLNDGITFNFANGQTIPAGGYLVVAKDAATLRAAYPSITIVGNFGKSLSHSTDNIVLKDAAGNPASQVRYYTDGHWHSYADGGGSSLELRDPNSDIARAESWDASDESSKSSWQTYIYRGVAQTNVGTEIWNDFVLGLLGDGECLIDDISVVQSPTNNPVQLISNGDFETGLTGWRLLGSHDYSRLETDPQNPGNHVLHIVSTHAQDHAHNHIETSLANGTYVTNGQTYEISFRAKWIAGNNLLNTRLYFDRVARTTALPMPDLNGTPGAQNSRFVTNAGPTFTQFQHSPIVPQPNQPITFSVVASDPQGVSACELWLSVNGAAFTQSPMISAGNGLYTKKVPGLPAGAIVQFFVRATDGVGTASLYPPAGTNSGALFAVADGNANLSLGHNIRIILTPANADALYSDLRLNSDENLPATMIYDEKRAYYDIGVRLKGSPSGRGSSVTMGYHLEFPTYDLFRGVHPVLLVDRSGGAGSYPQEEILIRHMLLHAGNLYGPQPDLGHVIPPSTAQISQAILIPRLEDEFISTAFPNGSSGTVFEFELIYYPITTNALGYKNSMPWLATRTDIRDLGDDKETYRYHYIIKNHRGTDDYSRVIALAKAFTPTNEPAASMRLKQVMDVDEWLRTFALLSLCGVSDTYTLSQDHNLVLYQRPSDQRIMAFPWDMDSVFYGATNAPLVGDENWGRIQNVPANLRRLYAHALDIMGSSFNTAYMDYWVHHYTNFAPNQDFIRDLTYIQNRSYWVTDEINRNGGFIPFNINQTNITTTNTLVAITGNAPVGVQTILINGIAYDVTWNSVSNWTIFVAVSSPTNIFNIAGYDLHGGAVSNATGTVTINYTGAPPQPVGSIVINEILFNPTNPGASFVELFNASPTVSFDISNWRLDGVGYTFPVGSILRSNQFLVLASDAVTFNTLYGTNVPAFDSFPNSLPTDVGTLALVSPGTNSTSDLIVAKVRYENAPPWPAATLGNSLQLLDVSQDNWRVANWSVQTNVSLPLITPGTNNDVSASLSAFPLLWLNELQVTNAHGLTDNFGEHDPWVELYNSSSNTLDLTGYYLSDDYTNLAKWPFPAGTTLAPRHFLTLWCDNEPGESASGYLHSNFRLTSGSGHLALSRPFGGTNQIVDYLNYTNLLADWSYGSVPDGQPFDRFNLYFATPADTNSAAPAPLGNPDVFNLSSGPFSFQNWADTNAATAYPSNIVFLQVTNSLGDPGLTDEMDSVWTLPYDRTSRSRVNGLGTNGFAFINTDNPQADPGAGFLGAAVLALNTLGQTNVRVAWTGGTVAANTRVYAIRLQYRVSVQASFSDVLDASGNPVEYVRNPTSGHSQILGPVKLPDSVTNRPYVELRWKYYFVSGASGSRAQLRVGNIAVASGTNEISLPISILGNPAFYHLSQGPYTFTTWNNTEAAGTYPTNMVFLQVTNSSGDPNLAAEMDSVWTLAYNLSSGTRINGLGTSGFCFINTGNPQASPGAGFLGAATLALNTVGRENVRVTWTGGTVTANPRSYGLRLQYRVGGIGSFQNVTNGNGSVVEYLSSPISGHSQTFGPITLPNAVNNQLYVELRWKYYYVSGTSGARPQLRVSNVSVTSSAPTAQNVTYSQTKGLYFKLSEADLLTHASGYGSLTLSTPAATVNGIELFRLGGWIYYGDVLNTDDSFDYTITSGGGLSASGTVNILASTATGASQIGAPANNIVTIQFFGIPGTNYLVQTTTNLLSPWRTISTNTAGEDGSWIFIDPDATNAQQYYRSAQP